MKTASCHLLTRSFECDHGRAKGDPDEACQSATKRMTDDPYVGIRIHVCQIIVKILQIIR